MRLQHSSMVNPTYNTFKDWAYSVWSDHYGQKPSWGKAEWALLHRGFKRLGFYKAKRAWVSFLQDGSDFVKGHNPKKWIFNLDRYATGAMGSDLIDPHVGKTCFRCNRVFSSRDEVVAHEREEHQ